MTFPRAIDYRTDERVVHLHLTAPGVPQESLCSALRALAPTSYANIRWRDYINVGRAPLEQAIEEAFERVSPTLFFAQVQEPWPLRPSFVEHMRTRFPDCDFVSWCGDIVDDCHWAAGWQYELYQYFHLACFSSMTQVELMKSGLEVGGRSRSLPNAEYLQIGWDEDLFPPPTEPQYPLKYDVVFLGNVYAKARADQLEEHNDQLRRVAAVQALRNHYGDRCGVFGSGWGMYGIEAHAVPLAEASDIYRSSRVGLSVSLTQTHKAYASDRMFHILASGVPLVYADFPGADVLGLPTRGIAEPFGDDEKYLLDLVDGFVATPRTADEQSRALALAGRHTWSRRMSELMHLRVSRRMPATHNWAPVRPLVERLPELAVRSDVPTVSVIFGTFNRQEALVNVVGDIRRSCRNGPSYEIVVCDGGSTDGSREWLAAQKDVVLVGKRSLDGAVDAYNHAFAVSRGEYILALNDDCRFEGSIPRLIMLLREHGDRAQIALRFKHDHKLHINTVHFGTKSEYANYSLTHRRLAKLVEYIQGGYWSPVYYTYGGDVELSMWIWALGLPVVPSGEAMEVDDLPAQDDLRTRNNVRAQAEADLLYLRWPSPEPGRHAMPSAKHVDSATYRRYVEVLRYLHPELPELM